MAKTYKQIEASRNRRLWITQVALPVAGTATGVVAMLYSGNPEFRNWANWKMHEAKVWYYEKTRNLKRVK
jgi:flagellar basal body-associated protein FliL